MDFLITKFNDTWGYISTGKDKSYGFSFDYAKVWEKLEKLDPNFTFATPEELALRSHQREWTQKDRIHYNKLKFLYDRWDYQRTQIMFLQRGLNR